MKNVLRYHSFSNQIKYLLKRAKNNSADKKWTNELQKNIHNKFLSLEKIQFPKMTRVKKYIKAMEIPSAEGPP